MPKLIAIIDDELEMEYLYGLMLEELIKSEQAKLFFFSEAESFLNWQRENTPDLVMTDINMPKITGVQLAQAVRDSGSSVPIYFISGYEEKDYHESLKHIGNCRFLSKPLSIDLILDNLSVDLGLQT